ncbi:MAG: protein kinase domain-containing protein [Streptosporangiaceae bacterium]
MGAPIVTGHVVAGRYRLISALGNGGMGTVWLAEDDILSRQVAVKEVSPPADMTERERDLLRERTLREAQTAARLSHPNVVTIYDVVEDDGRPWIVMELVRSRSLRELVEAEGPLTAQQAARVGLQVLTALNAAHALGIMHRDVKPGNVLIDPDGRAILADFGIARTQDSPALTTSGVLVGSPSYIAPERARGERGGPESDLWSLGATLYALVEGRPAYDRAGALPTLMAVVNEDPDPPSRAGTLWPVIRGLLDHVPSRRLGPDEAERMLRQIAGSEGGSKTAPWPAALPAPREEAAGGGIAGRTRAGGSLESAEHTRTLRLWDAGPPAEPESGPLAPEAGPLRDEPDPQALPDQPDPLALPDEPGPDALPDQPDPQALPDQPGPDALPDQPGPDALPDGPDPQPLALPGDPKSYAGPSDSAAVPREPGPAVVPEAGEAIAPVLVAAEERAPQPVRPPEPGDTDAALIPGLPGRPGTAARTQEIGRSPRRKPLVWVLAAAAAVVLVASVVASMILTSHHTPRAAADQDHSSGRPASSHPASPTPSATSAAPTTAPPSSPAPTPSSTSGSGALGPAVIPASYHGFRNSTGFSIAVPAGWRVSHQGHYVYLLPPSGADFLLIDQSDHPQPNPLQDWQQQEANRESTYPGYHRIRLESVRYPQAEKAADWEFTYYHQGVLTHVLNRNVLANAHHAYALYWSTPASEWGQSWHIFKVLAQTFRPAAP